MKKGKFNLRKGLIAIFFVVALTVVGCSNNENNAVNNEPNNSVNEIENDNTENNENNDVDNNTANNENNTANNEENEVEEDENEEVVENISVEIELSSGNYTAGIDFPAGKYNILAVDGGGNVSSDNMFSGGINAIMGVADDGFYELEYKNISLPQDTVLRVSGVTILITCDDASAEALAPRNQDITETFEFGNGNYVAGEDFPAGVYNIKAVDGNGNVSSDNIFDGGINAIMGVKNDGFYELEYLNIELPEGTMLSLSGVTVELTPSK